ncbi:hypothetical protein PEPS_31410 (plasmid) [Persicobacter psychrovividus]|uniref:Uncharacterized protein n=1 Tax=Persicobacter psychrovividus TaxID=387638 RepID=A0ABM7VIT1_9BACT|nr:hypothetical protein PEPS_31410 [Persicobacter psychrovividus]
MKFYPWYLQPVFALLAQPPMITPFYIAHGLYRLFYFVNRIPPTQRHFTILFDEGDFKKSGHFLRIVVPLIFLSCQIFSNGLRRYLWYFFKRYAFSAGLGYFYIVRHIDFIYYVDDLCNFTS